MAIPLVAFLLASCADDRVAGRGVASETTNGTIVAGFLKDGDGRPAAGVRVDLRDPSLDKLIGFDTSASDGAWRIPVPSPGRFQVATAGDSLGATGWITVGSLPLVEVGTLERSVLQRLSGRVSGAIAGKGGLVARLPGLGRETPVGPDSTWDFGPVPPGNHLVQVRDAFGNLVGEGAASVWRRDTVSLDPYSGLLLDAFEGPEGQSLLQPILDGAWWGRWNDTSANPDSFRTWSGIVGLASADSSWEGRSLRVPMLVGDTIPSRANLNRSAGLQLKIGGREDLDSQSVWHDLRRIDSVSFVVRGSGRFTFRIRARDRTEHSRHGGFSTEISPSGVWTRVVLRPTDFLSEEGLRWDGSEAIELHWITVDSAALLGLDDLRFHGPRMSDLLRR
ncbi:MAG: hypothetical protein H6686_05880 [Fibrobacteria bacterium]|nr:hypothetical protein [Fibrobacteria bacterium]